MVAWSSFVLKNITRNTLARRAIICLKNEPHSGREIKNAISYPLVRGHRTMEIVPSRFSWNKFKDMLHFYLLLGILPLGLLVLYVNIFIGPATLAVIPEGYEPKPWEYYQHPISRFFAKYFTISPQESHERNCHNLFIQHERFLIRQLENKIEKLIKERMDYQAYYMSPRPSKYQRRVAEVSDEQEEFVIQTHGWVK